MITAQNRTSAFTITPANAHYGIAVQTNASGVNNGYIDFQRSQVTAGVYVDDPRPDAQKRILLPQDDATKAAVAQIIALIPGFAAAAGVTGTLTNVGVRLKDVVLSDGTLDLNCSIQGTLNGNHVNLDVGSLNTFLTAHPLLAPGIMSAWAALDAAIDALNATNKWV